MAWGDPNPLFTALYGQHDDELQEKLKLAKEQKKSPAEIGLIQAEIDADTKHQQQQLMKIAATAGASSGGSAISSVGQKMPYGDTAMFNPKAMPPRYLPGTKPREEDELIPPGFAQFPYRMYR